MNKTYKIIIVIILVIILIFWIWYITRMIYDLKEINIRENIILSIKWKEWLFILNPNNEEIKSFSWNFSKLEDINLSISTKIYNPNNKYYFNISGVYNNNDKLLNRTWLCPIKNCKAFWTEDSNYLIRMDWHVVRLFWLFFSTPTVQQVIHIIEPETKKSKQILLYDENWKLMEIEKIEGYVLDN